MQPSETPHVDADTLALLALGEVAGGGRDADHLGGCPRCQSEVDQLKAVVHAGRTTTPSDQPQSPPASVWERVVAELDLDSASPDADVVVLRPRHRRSRSIAGLLVAAAAAGVLVGGAATWAFTRDDAVTPEVIAGVQLDPLANPSAQGEATIVQAGEDRAVEVNVDGLEDRDVFYQVWLIDAETQRLISLGVLDASDRGSFQLPAGIDLSEFPVVDVSAEPYDGDPAHSSVSVVRGTLQA